MAEKGVLRWAQNFNVRLKVTLLTNTSGAVEISIPERALILNTFPHITIFSRI